MRLPPGFGFRPTDNELVSYYLRRKVARLPITTFPIGFELIPELELYKQEPWDLPEKLHTAGRDMEWYFFCPLGKKYANGRRCNRATEVGFWKPTGMDREVKEKGRTVGMKKTLVFYLGRRPVEERTDWVMHEYRLDDEYKKLHASQELFVLCKVFKKSGVGKRTGDDRGPQTCSDDDIDAGSFLEAVKLQALEPGSGTASTSTIAAAPEEMPKVAPIDRSPISAPCFPVGGLAWDDIDMPTDFPLEDLLDEIFINDCHFWKDRPKDLPTLEDEQDSSELVRACEGDTETETPSGVKGKSNMSSNVQQHQQTQEEEFNVGVGFWDTYTRDARPDLIPSVLKELVGRM